MQLAFVKFTPEIMVESMVDSVLLLSMLLVPAATKTVLQLSKMAGLDTVTVLMAQRLWRRDAMITSFRHAMRLAKKVQLKVFTNV